MATLDLLSYSSVTPESFPVEPRRVVLGQHSMNCVSLSDTARSCAVVVAQRSVSCRSCSAHQVIVVFLSSRQFITRLCVPDLR